MVVVGVALVAALGALVGTGALVSRAFDQRRSHLFAWALTQVGLCAGLGAMAVGLLAGFNGPLFRVMELGAALIAPLWLAMGVVELVTRPVPVKFLARLVVVSYSIVSAVIVSLDPLRGKFGTELPKPDDHYEWLPQTVIAGSHLIAVATLVVCALVTALHARDMERESYDVLLPVALIALAGVLIVSGTRAYLPPGASVFALGAASALIWFGAVRTIPRPGEYDEAYDGYDGYDGYQQQGYDDRPRSGYDGGYDEDPRPRHRRGSGPEPASMPLGAPPPMPAAPPQPYAEPMAPPQPYAEPMVPPYADQPRQPIPPGAYGQITVYTLLDGREAAFDRLSREAVQAAQHGGEPGTLIFACHEVVGAPTQRIFYQLFRDQAAFEEHQRQPYVRQFMADSRSHVIATNIIELRLDAAKVLPMGPPAGQELPMGGPRPWT
ncbi:MAG TPA: antibiotic biosynthesis monooxygenase [Streptosporangiaceae bacterium]|jgi:quinol monooxygenase YgiN